jgi:hypothetical protein
VTPNEQAKEQLARLQSWLTSSNALALVSQRIGHDISGYPLDGPIPDFPAHTERGQAFSKTLLEMARREKMTLRDLYNVTAAARGHWVIYGTPSRIADIFEDWFTGGLADGFVIMPAYFPGAFDAFVDRVIPELQRRGLYREEYTGTTLRSHLGLMRSERRHNDLQQAASYIARPRGPSGPLAPRYSRTRHSDPLRRVPAVAMGKDRWHGAAA